MPDGAGGIYQVPEADLVTMAVSVGAAYCLALAAALRIRSAWGLVIVAGTVYSLYQAPLSKLQEGGSLTGLHGADVWLRWAQLGVLALLCILALGTAILRRKEASGQKAAASSEGSRAWLAPGLAATCAVAYFALELGAWGVYARAGQIATGTESLIDDLGLQTLLVPLVLTLVVLLYSTDLLDWGEVVTGRIVYLTGQSRPKWFPVLTPLAALAVVAYVVWRAPAMVPLELVVGAVIAGAALLLARRTDGYAGWSDEMRSRAVVAGAVAYFAYTTGLSLLTGEVSSATGIPGWDLYWAVAVPLLAAGLAVGSYLLARARADRGNRSDWRTLVLFLMLMGIMVLARSLVYFPGAIGLRAIFPAQYSPVDGVQLATALAALGWSGWGKVRRRPVARLDELFGLLVCLALVTVIAQMLSGITALSGLSPYPLAAFFLIFGAWGVIAAGDQLNGDSDRYPRSARLMLFASYTIMTDAIVGFLGTLRTPVTGEAAMQYLTTDYTTPAGLATMGSAIVVMAYFFRRLRGQEPRQPATPRAIAAAPSPEAVLQGPARSSEGPARSSEGPARSLKGPARSRSGKAQVRLGATLAVVLVLAVVSGCAGPQTAGSYKASPAPGPECDKHGALWTVPNGEPVTTQCTAAGVDVTVSADNAGDVQFAPPVDSFSRNYSVSVKVTFGSLTDGCVSIYTRSSGDGHYTSYICDSQAVGQGYQWGLERITPGKQWLLALGQLATSSGAYTLAAAAENTTQRITINGETASGTDSTLSATKYIALGISNAGRSPGRSSSAISPSRHCRPTRVRRAPTPRNWP